MPSQYLYLEIILASIFWLQGMRIPSYDNQLLDLAEDLARRMLPAFDTPTGMTGGYSILLHVIFVTQIFERQVTLLHGHKICTTFVFLLIGKSFQAWQLITSGLLKACIIF